MVDDRSGASEDVMSEPVIEGAWALRRYIVAGTPHDVVGLLLFADGRWATVYFTEADTDTPWGNGEGGLYERTGTALRFIHRHVIQGGATRPLTVTPRHHRVEDCTIALTAATLRIDFPSGNTLLLERAVED